MPNNKPQIRQQASGVWNFFDNDSGGLLAIERDVQGRLLLDFYRLDPDIIIRVNGRHTEAPLTALQTENARLKALNADLLTANQAVYRAITRVLESITTPDDVPTQR